MNHVDDEPSRVQNLHALSGVVPVGVFLVVHVVTNSRALAGQAALTRASTFWDGVPLASLIEVVFVLLPLAFHAGYGVVRLVRKEPAQASPYSANWRLLVRGSAWVTLAFILYHAYAMELPRWTRGVGALDVPTVLTAHLSSATGSAAGVLMPWTAIVYLVGIAATTLHFAAGSWGYLVRTKRAPTAETQRRAAIVAGAVGTVLFGLASLTVISVATGSPLFPQAAEAPPCPAPQSPLPPERPSTAAPSSSH